MARKFLYVIAGIVVLLLVVLLALRFWSDELSEFAFVPRTAYEEQAALDSTVYAEPNMWFAWPAMESSNPAHFTPEGVTGAPPSLPAAVFFVHPTSYVAKEYWNAPLDDPESRDRGELFVSAMASPFAASDELWAPRYRQAAFGAFLSDSPDATKALDLAYGDVLAAFDEFIRSSEPGLPIVLAGHSQGAFHLKRLLKDRVEGKPLARRIAVVYAVGWPISIEHDLPQMGVPACSSPEQAGCVMSWLAFAEPADTRMILEGYARRPALDGKGPGGSSFLCSNPLTGGIGGSAPAAANLGTLIPSDDLKSGRLEKGMVPARCDADGFLMIGEPPKLGAYVLPGNNFHIYDIPLFWGNLRADVARRVQAWKPS